METNHNRHLQLSRRENKNQVVLAFLYLLIQLNIVNSVFFQFLYVGHTGFAPDQMFSILANEFKKTDIRTIENLMSIIANSPINPKPEVQSLDYIFDFKNHILPLMAQPLKNHTFYKVRI